MTGDQIKRVSAVLKKRFTNLTVEETLNLAIDVLSAAGL